MKVLLINSVCGIKSTGRICSDLAEILEKNGHICKIAYGRETVPEKSKKFAHRIISDKQVKIDALKTRFLDNAGFNSKKSTLAFIEWIKNFNPDIIHLHNIHGYYINIEVLIKFLKEFNKPVVWTLHDCWAFTGHCSHFTLRKCYKWKTGCYGCPAKKAYPASVLIDNSKNNYKKKKELFTSLEKLTIITPSNWLADLARESFLGKYPVYAIPNGVDLDVFVPTESDFRKRHGLENKKIIMGAATAWSSSKGIPEFSRLSKILPEDYKIVLVGITESIASTLPNEILALPRTNSIQELAEIYTAADVFANISKQETMGLTTVEAMACGTPVVTSNLTAVPEVVTKDGGIVLDSISPEEILKGIDKVLATEYLNTRANALLYEKNTQYNKYIDLYKQMGV